MPDGICSVSDCPKPARFRGWCRNHYQRWLRHGDPLAGRRSPLTGSHEERFWAKVDKNGPVPAHRPALGPCWLWTAFVADDGYGHFAHPGGLRAHRFAYTRMVGPIPEGLTIDHLCTNRRCVNPAHLEPVTRGENTLRGTGPSAINARKTHCKYGHLYDEVNTYWYRGERQCRECRRDRLRRDRRRTA